MDGVKQIAQAHDLPLIDHCAVMADVFTADNCEKYMPDRVHPNEAGHELMAQRIQLWRKKISKPFGAKAEY